VSALSANGLSGQLREAGEDELAALVAEHADRLGLAEARAILHNPFVTTELLGRVASSPELAGLYEVRRELAAHPRTPRALAVQLVAGLYWRDLAALGIDPRVHPLVRRSADRRLHERLPGLAVGEKIALARRASAFLVSALRFDPSPRVVTALLENPRLTEAQLLPLASHERANPRCLEALAASTRWATRRGVRAALCRNPATPVGTALRLLPGLSRNGLAAVAADVRLAVPLRSRARELTGSHGR
jgi:hypothetical protein